MLKSTPPSVYNKNVCLSVLFHKFGSIRDKNYHFGEDCPPLKGAAKTVKTAATDVADWTETAAEDVKEITENLKTAATLYSIVDDFRSDP